MYRRLAKQNTRLRQIALDWRTGDGRPLPVQRTGKILGSYLPLLGQCDDMCKQLLSLGMGYGRIQHAPSESALIVSRGRRHIGRRQTRQGHKQQAKNAQGTNNIPHGSTPFNRWVTGPPQCEPPCARYYAGNARPNLPKDRIRFESVVRLPAPHSRSGIA